MILFSLFLSTFSQLYGKFLSSLVEIDDAAQWLLKAHTCYMQWGAAAKATQLQNDHNLVLLMPGESLSSNKHERDDEDREGLV